MYKSQSKVIYVPSLRIDTGLNGCNITDKVIRSLEIDLQTHLDQRRWCIETGLTIRDISGGNFNEIDIKWVQPYMVSMFVDARAIMRYGS